MTIISVTELAAQEMTRIHDLLDEYDVPRDGQSASQRVVAFAKMHDKECMEAVRLKMRLREAA